MPYQRPGNSVYVVNGSGGIYTHGQAVKEGNFVGIAVKQKATHWSDGLAVQAQIQINEPYLMLRRGIVQVPDGGANFVDGDAVYITSGNVLTKTVGSNTKFGRVVEVVGDGRGVPAGLVRINLDERESF